MQKGDIILLEMTGKDSESGKVFETTSEETAKSSGVFTQGSSYRPTALVVGKGRMIQGVEEALLEMKVGEERKITLGPEKAFGERRPDLVGIVPLKEFIARKVQPFPGLVVDVNGNAGRIQSVSGGRVRVDFNNDLAGKTVEYDLKIVKKLEEPEEKAKALVSKVLGLEKEISMEFNKESQELVIGLPEEVEHLKEIDLLKQFLQKELSGDIPELKKVSFKEHDHAAHASEAQTKQEPEPAKAKPDSQKV